MKSKSSVARIPFNDLPEHLLGGMYTTESYLKEAELPTGLLELVRVKVAQLSGCGYCLDRHWKLGRRAGLSEQVLYALPQFRDYACYSRQEQAVLSWTERVVLGGDSPDWERDFASLVGELSLEQCAQLTLAAAQSVAWAKLSKGFGFPAGSFEAR